MFSKSLDRKVGKLNNPDGGLVFQGSLKVYMRQKCLCFSIVLVSHPLAINIQSSTKTLTEQRLSIS